MISYATRTAAAASFAAALLGMPAATFAEGTAAGPVNLAGHRAIYDLKLASTRGRRTVASAQGRIVYDFSGSSCEGYSLQFRQVTEIDGGEGKVALSDLRSTSWEEGSGKSYRFKFQNYISRRLVDSVDGHAERTSDGIKVKLKLPSEKEFTLSSALLFPTEHMRHIIEAARAGKTLLEVPVYDGSETGQKIYSTLSVIGHEIPPGTKLPTDAAKGKQELAALRRWPVTISYFDKSKSEGEQMPVYAITFELYENGISRGLTLDYGDFAVAGEMSTLELRKAKPCP